MSQTRAGKRSSIQAPSATTIFAQMTQLAERTQAVNLGQGFPDTAGPAEVLNKATDAIAAGINQYPPARGLPELTHAIAAHHKHLYGLEYSAMSEVLVTMGATEAIAASIMAFVSPGDEVVMFEPYYDSYAAMVERVGGVRKTVPLRFPDAALDFDALRRAVTPQTAVILVNTPHNPTGRVFTREELAEVARLAEEVDAVVLSDEVYEHLVFDAREHIPMASLPGMRERTVTFGSGGKTFSTTGWKVGWSTGPADLIAAVTGVKQFLTYAGAAPLQMGIAAGLQLPDEVFTGLARNMQARRDQLVSGLEKAGFTVAVPEGGYFVLADAAPLGITNAEEFALALPAEAGVVAVPASVFCDDATATGMASVMRFAFCKEARVIGEATERLIHRYGGK